MDHCSNKMPDTRNILLHAWRSAPAIMILERDNTVKLVEADTRDHHLAAPSCSPLGKVLPYWRQTVASRNNTPCRYSDARTSPIEKRAELQL